MLEFSTVQWNREKKRDKKGEKKQKDKISVRRQGGVATVSGLKRN